MLPVSANDLQTLADLVQRGQTKARVLTRAHMRLQSTKGGSVAPIAEASQVCQATVYTTWHRYRAGTGGDRPAADARRARRGGRGRGGADGASV